MAIEIAMDYRHQFKKDVVVDLICFRKLGHNEQDEPMVTQPLMYKKVQAHLGTRKLYGDKLVAQGICAAGEPDQIIKDYRAALDRARAALAVEDCARLERVAERIREFAEAQKRALGDVTVTVPGGTAGHWIAPLERAGCYAPGGRYPLPSSVLMTAVTARTAGGRPP